jgi:hypothetical protein
MLNLNLGLRRNGLALGRGTLLITLAAASILAAALLASPQAATAAGGGVSAGGNDAAKKRKHLVPGRKAKLRRGRAIPPAKAPRRIRKVIRAANKIRNKPYKYGGGHGRWNDSGYDCSGAVSYALRGGKLLRSPLDSRGLARWKKRGKGRWLTVYGAPSHAYMVVAGLRFDTSMVPGNGPGWSRKMRSTPERYSKRRAPRL